MRDTFSFRSAGRTLQGCWPAAFLFAKKQKEAYQASLMMKHYRMFGANVASISLTIESVLE
jgi:hypothetical protein